MLSTLVDNLILIILHAFDFFSCGDDLLLKILPLNVIFIGLNIQGILNRCKFLLIWLFITPVLSILYIFFMLI